MKTKTILFLSLLAASWGTLGTAGACPCVDKETVSINLSYHGGSILVENAVLAKLHDANLIAMVKASLVQDQAKINELKAISINAGIPEKPSDLSAGFDNRAAQAVADFANLTGPALDNAYLTFRTGELQRLITAFDTYFITDATTPTIKAWLPGERVILVQQYNTAVTLQKNLTQALALSL